MRRMCAIVLILTVAAEGVSAAGTEAAGDLRGPLARAISRQASKLAADASTPPEAPIWQAVRELEPGNPIIVTTTRTTLAGTFVAADGVGLTLRVGDATESVKAEDVLLVARRVRRGSGAAATLGTLGGIWLASVLAVGLVENARCYQGCAGVGLAVWSVIIGVPTATGYGAWHHSSRVREEVVYRTSGRP